MTTINQFIDNLKWAILADAANLEPTEEQKRIIDTIGNGGRFIGNGLKNRNGHATGRKRKPSDNAVKLFCLLLFPGVDNTCAHFSSVWSFCFDLLSVDDWDMLLYCHLMQGETKAQAARNIRFSPPGAERLKNGIDKRHAWARINKLIRINPIFSVYPMAHGTGTHN